MIAIYSWHRYINMRREIIELPQSGRSTYLFDLSVRRQPIKAFTIFSIIVGIIKLLKSALLLL